MDEEDFRVKMWSDSAAVRGYTVANVAPKQYLFLSVCFYLYTQPHIQLFFTFARVLSPSAPEKKNDLILMDT